jgi:hypothetical protein
MRKWWKRSLALSLGLLAGGARASDPAPAVQLGRPVIATAGPQAAVSLNRPVPLAATVPAVPAAVFDPALQPTGYSNPTDGNSADLPPLLIRAQAPDPTVTTGPLPMPTGPVDPATTAQPPSPSIWHRSPATTQPPGMPAALATGGSTVVASAGPALQASADPTATSPASQAPAGQIPVSQPPVIAGPVWSMLHGGYCPDDCNGNGNADCCDGCTFGNRYYVSTDYLLWFIKGSNTPPLVTRGSAGDPIPGALGLPGTTVLFGGGSVENDPFSGGRLNAGYWFGDQHLLGIDFSGFFLGQTGKNFSATSTGTPILTRPFVDAATGTETTELVAGPGVLAGTVSVNTESQMWGYEANLRSNLCAGQFCGVDYFVDGILGFRGLGLDESIHIDEALAVLGGPSAGQQFAIADHFNTQNRFYGGQFGFLTEYRWDRWVLDVNTKFGFGPTQEMVRISGSTAITPVGGPTQVFNGGLLALPSNIGNYTRDTFTFVPEFGLNLGYQCTDHIKIFVGYTFLYWSDVVRPGEQIDRVVNTNQLPPAIPGGPARPQFTFNGSDFWAQGVNFGVEFKY